MLERGGWVRGTVSKLDTAERRGWHGDGAGFGRKQGRSESEVNDLRSLCGVLGK